MTLLLIALLSATAPIALVESWPLETTLDHSRIADAKDVWPELVAHAKNTLDFAEFYASAAPKGSPHDALEPTVQAIEAAADRGVKVRFLAEEVFYKTYPETLDRLARKKGIEVRRFDVKHTMGGILHAKYFVVDGERVYLGSQNFDYRSLEHIQELGVSLSVPQVASALEEIFETDWALAGGAAKEQRAKTHGEHFPVNDGVERVSFVASPKGFLPDQSLWDLPALVAAIDAAKKSVRVQLLTYGTKGDFTDLESALTSAAARKVRVEVLLSDWSTRKGTIESVRRLAATPGVSVSIITIPPWSGGEVPFGRVAHAKYMVIDGEKAWVGTSNWERSYFFESRNVGVIIDGGRLPEALDSFFAGNWKSAYAKPFAD